MYGEREVAEGGWAREVSRTMVGFHVLSSAGMSYVSFINVFNALSMAELMATALLRKAKRKSGRRYWFGISVG